MSPWYHPTYVTRVWCIFEIGHAHRLGCQITIIMPPSEKKELEMELFGDAVLNNMDILNDVLAKTRIQDAQATFESDRLAIL